MKTMVNELYAMGVAPRILNMGNDNNENNTNIIEKIKNNSSINDNDDE